jgi:CDGSH-type Zn-finger protein
MATQKPAGAKKTTEGLRIKITKDGPYIVTGGVPLSKQKIGNDSEGHPLEWAKVEDYPLQQVYALCRCGQSRNMPFCDGSHAKSGFDGEETAERAPFSERARWTQGPDLDLMDVPVCMGAGFCHRGGGIWNLVEHSDDPEARRIAIEVAGNCPSGRLTVFSKEGENLDPEYEPSIVVVEDPETGRSGPLWVRGGITIESADGSTYEVHHRVALCRCGKSTNKPLCDGSHMIGQR